MFGPWSNENWSVRWNMWVLLVSTGNICTLIHFHSLTLFVVNIFCIRPIVSFILQLYNREDDLNQLWGARSSSWSSPSSSTLGPTPFGTTSIVMEWGISACRSKGPRTPSSSLALRLPHIHGNLPPTLPKKWLCWRLPEASSTWHIKEEIPSSTSSTTWDKLLLWATQLPSSVTSSGHSDGNFTFCTEVAMFSVLYPLCDYLLGLLLDHWKSCSFTRHPTN